MKTRSLVRSLCAALVAVMLVSGLCTGAASAATAETSYPNTSAGEPTESITKLAPPPVETPIYYDEEPNTPIETIVPPPPVDPVTPVSPTVKLRDTRFWLGTPSFVYDYSRGELKMVFALSDAGVISQLIARAKVAQELPEALAEMRGHFGTKAHKPSCVDPSAEYRVQEILQELLEPNGGSEFSVVGNDGLLNIAESTLKSREYKALVAVLEPLTSGAYDPESLTERFSAEKLAGYRQSLVKAASYYWPEFVERIDTMKITFTLPVTNPRIETNIKVGVSETIGEPACG